MKQNEQPEKLKQEFILKTEERLTFIKLMTAKQMFSPEGRANIELMRSEVVASYFTLCLFISEK